MLVYVVSPHPSLASLRGLNEFTVSVVYSYFCWICVTFLSTNELFRIGIAVALYAVFGICLGTLLITSYCGCCWPSKSVKFLHSESFSFSLLPYIERPSKLKMYTFSPIIFLIFYVLSLNLWMHLNHFGIRIERVMQVFSLQN